MEIDLDIFLKSNMFINLMNFAGTDTETFTTIRGDYETTVNIRFTNDGRPMSCMYECKKLETN